MESKIDKFFDSIPEGLPKLLDLMIDDLSIVMKFVEANDPIIKATLERIGVIENSEKKISESCKSNSKQMEKMLKRIQESEKKLETF